MLLLQTLIQSKYRSWFDFVRSRTASEWRCPLARAAADEGGTVAAAAAVAEGPGRGRATAAGAGAETAGAGADRRPTTGPNPGADPGNIAANLCRGNCGQYICSLVFYLIHRGFDKCFP